EPFDAHPQLRFSGQPQACHHLAALFPNTGGSARTATPARYFLRSAQQHLALSSMMRGITPAERDFPFGKRDQTIVRDSYAMGVAAEIFEYVLWPTERRFRVNHPVVMNRLKALYRSWGIPCAGTEVYALRYRAEWLAKISEAGVRRRAEHYYQ